MFAVGLFCSLCYLFVLYSGVEDLAINNVYFTSVTEVDTYIIADDEPLFFTSDTSSPPAIADDEVAPAEDAAIDAGAVAGGVVGGTVAVAGAVGAVVVVRKKRAAQANKVHKLNLYMPASV